MNRYTYARGNPVKYNDPSGHCAGPLCIAGAIGAVGGGVFSLGYYAGSAHATGESLNLRDALTAVSGGAVGGFVAGATLGAGAVVLPAVAGTVGTGVGTYATGAAIGAAGGIVGGEAGNITTNALNGMPLDSGFADPASVAWSAGLSAIPGGIEGAIVSRAFGPSPLFRPGSNARGSIRSPSRSQRFSADTRTSINNLGEASGCHLCGSPSPGTVSGNWVPDHIPVSSRVPRGYPQRLYPSCLHCSRAQGLAAANSVTANTFSR